jgi:hypothetical protein
MPDQDTARIPLHARDGSVRAYAIVDITDAEWVNQWKWQRLSTGHAVRSSRDTGQRRFILLHRELLGLPRISDGREGDHINRDRLDNRRTNLRIVPKAGQQQNTRPQTGRTSAHRGVSWLKERNRWEAYVQINGKKRRLGRFVSETEAAEAARAARARLMPYATD